MLGTDMVVVGVGVGEGVVAVKAGQVVLLPWIFVVGLADVFC